MAFLRINYNQKGANMLNRIAIQSDAEKTYFYQGAYLQMFGQYIYARGPVNTNLAHFMVFWKAYKINIHKH